MLLYPNSRFSYDNKNYIVNGHKRLNENEYNISATELEDNSVSNDYKKRFISFFKEHGITFNEYDICEQNISDSFCKLFEKDFEIIKQVSGKHYNGKNLCIDLVLIPKDTTLIKNKNLVFGIEIKNPFTANTKGRMKQDLLAQCLDYSETDFINYKDMIVLICPIPPKYEYEHSIMNFLTRYNVGHVSFSKSRMYFKFGDQTLWNNDNGFGNLTKVSMLKRKTGNRAYKAK
jgi:hypothetical protein